MKLGKAKEDKLRGDLEKEMRRRFTFVDEWRFVDDEKIARQLRDETTAVQREAILGRMDAARKGHDQSPFDITEQEASIKA